MDDKEQAAIDALRASGLGAEALAVEKLRRRHNESMAAYHAGQRASYTAGLAEERERWTKPAALVLDDALQTKLAEIERLRAALESTRSAMVELAALAGAEMNASIPWAALDANARALLKA